MSTKIDFTTFAYSTDEQIVGSWIDGRPIYKKTIYRASIDAGDIDILHGISNLDLCIKIEAFETAASHTTLPLPTLASTSDGNYASPWTISDSRVKFFSSLRLTDVYITLYYTKSS